jgi:hypothetical protein
MCCKVHNAVAGFSRLGQLCADVCIQHNLAQVTCVAIVEVRGDSVTAREYNGAQSEAFSEAASECIVLCTVG